MSRDLDCDVRYAGDTAPEFYAATACATLITAGGVLYGPANIPAGGAAAPRTAFTPVSQTGPTGGGTTSDPFLIETIVDLGDTGIRLTQQDTYVTGQQNYKTVLTIRNTGASAQSVHVYRAGDCYVSDSDYGYGRASGDSVACVSSGGRVAQWVPLTSGSSYLEDTYSRVWGWIGSRRLFPDTVRENDFIDNGAGLSWPKVVLAGQEETVAHVTAFSPEAQANDRDGDGLPDDWESNGLDTDGDGDVDIDLPAMGASPHHKDLFVEVDWMEKEPTCIWIHCWGARNFEPDQDALRDVVTAFAEAPVDNPDGEPGIRLHIDSGSGAVMNPETGATWGDRSRANRVTYSRSLGQDNASGEYDWTEFNALKAGNFMSSRADVFHYTIYVDRYAGSRSSGIAQVPDYPFEGDSFIVAQGAWGDFTRRQESGTFMHEFGHTLGLRHGGEDDYNFKPNYLSIMNYAWQMGDRPLDYSRSAVQDLYEDALWERAGLPGAEGTFARFCPDPEAPRVDGTPTGYRKYLESGTGGVDWNCSGALEEVTAFDVNTGSGTLLTGFEDWSNLAYDGGAVGEFGASDLRDQDPPLVFSEADEATHEEFMSRDSLAADGDGTVSLEGTSALIPGVSDQSLTVKVSNAGNVPASYSLSLTGIPGVASSVAVPDVEGYGTESLLIPVDAGALSPGTYELQVALYRPEGGEYLSQVTVEIVVPDMADPAVRAEAAAALQQLSNPQEGLDEELRASFVRALSAALAPELTLEGFHAPILGEQGAWNVVKAGSVVPLKFEVFEGDIELTDVEVVAGLTRQMIDCDAGVGKEDIADVESAGRTALRYDPEAGQFVQNWKSPRTPGACYKVTLTTTDNSTLSALFALK